MGLFPEALKDKLKFLSTYSLSNIQNLVSKRKKEDSLQKKYKITITYANWLAVR